MANNMERKQSISGELSDDQVSVLEEFRNRLQDELQPMFDDHFLLRFLKARSFKIDKAEKMIREHFKLRKKVCADRLQTDYVVPEVIQKHFSFCHLGYDVDGDMIIAYLDGLNDVKGFCRSVSWIEQLKFSIHHIESFLIKMKKENEKTGKKGRKVVAIHDLTGMRLSSFIDTLVAKNMLDLMMFVQANYPEILKNVYFLNVPSFFHSWFNVAKKFIDPEPLSKIHIYGNDGWQKDMFAKIDPNIVPAFLGGNLTDPDGNKMCNTLFIRDTKIPTSYYIKDRKSTIDPEMTKVLIHERSYFNHIVEVNQINAIVRWTFQTVDYNLNFAVYFAPKGVKPMPKVWSPKFSQLLNHEVMDSRNGHDPLVALERVDSQVIPENGEIRCERIGTYFLHFDNTYSWLRSKELYYKVSVLPPSTPSYNEVISKITETA